MQDKPEDGEVVQAGLIISMQGGEKLSLEQVRALLEARRRGLQGTAGQRFTTGYERPCVSTTMRNRAGKRRGCY